MADRPSYRPYRAQVSGIQRLSRHFTRVTFTGADFATFGTAGLDQRIKLVFPLPGIGMSDFGAADEETIGDGDWYSRWRDLPDAERNPFRTYTIRRFRPLALELDVDFVVHPVPVRNSAGPAAHWLATAAVGDEIVVIGPDARSSAVDVGLDWSPGRATRLLLAGDETAAPAICGILETLPPGQSAQAFIEVPTADDALPVTLPERCTITWLVREDSLHGQPLDSAVRAWVASNHAALATAVVAAPQIIPDIDSDRDLLWDSPRGGAENDFYAWLAGEAGMIKKLRRFLVTDTGVDRSRVAFMGYWRIGRGEAQE